MGFFSFIFGKRKEAIVGEGKEDKKGDRNRD